MRTLAIVIIGLVTLTSCNHSTENSQMMHNNGGSYYWECIWDGGFSHF